MLPLLVSYLISIFFLFFIQKLVILFIEVIAVYMGEFQGFCADNFKFGTAFITGDDVALFDFIDFEIQWGLAFWTIGHDASSFICSTQAL